MLLALLLLFLGGYAVMRSSTVQTWLAQRLAGYLSSSLGTEVRIDRVDIEFIKTLELEGLYIEDLEGDTLLSAPRILTDIRVLGIDRNVIGLRSVTLAEPRIKLKKYPGKDHLNLQFLVDHFAPEGEVPAGKPPHFLADHISISGGHFSYQDLNTPSEDTAFGIDFRDLDVRNIKANITGFAARGDSVQGRVEHLSLSEKSGFHLDTLRTEALISPDKMAFDQSRIRTPGSGIDLDLAFRYQGMKAFNNFIDSVNMEATIDTSRLQFGDISYFAPDLEGLQQVVQVAGEVNGTVKDLKGKGMRIAFASGSHFQGDVDLSGLPDIQRTFIAMDVEEAISNREDLETIPLPPFKEGHHLKVPANLAELGQMRFSGNFTGFFNDLVAYGTLNTSIGKLKTDISLRSDPGGTYHYQGKLATYDLHLGRLYGLKEVGRLNSFFHIKGKGLKEENINAEIDGKIRGIDLKGYTYQDISIKGELARNKFAGEVNVRDDHLALQFNGEVDVQASPHVYHFTSEISHAHLNQLNLIGRDSMASFNTRLEFNATGNSLDDLEGTLKATDTRYEETKGSVEAGEILLNVGEEQGEKVLSLETPFVDLTASGHFRSEELVPSLLQQLYEALPSLEQGKGAEISRDQDFELQMALKNMSPLTELFAPGIEIPDPSIITAKYDAGEGIFDLDAMLPSFRLKGKEFKGVRLNVEKSGDVFRTTAEVEGLELNDTTTIAGLNLAAKAYRDNVSFSLGWDSGKPRTTGSIEGVAYVHGPERFEFDLLQSEFLVNKANWSISEESRISVDSNAVRVDSLLISSRDQSLFVNGVVSNSAYDKMRFELNDFWLGYLDPFINLGGAGLDGTIDGKAVLSDVYHDLKFLSNLRIDSLALGDHALGDVEMNSQWDHERKKIDLRGKAVNDGRKGLSFEGEYTPGKEKSPLDVALQLDHFDLGILNTFIQEGISGIKGNASGTLELLGSIQQPKLSGTVDVDSTQIKVDELNTRYFIHDQPITFYDEMITFDYIPFHDQEGNQAYATGTLIHQDFTQWSFNVFLEFTQCDRFLCLNTTKQMNDLYYGKAYATGTVEVSGYADQLEITVTAKSEKGTNLNLPLSGSEEVTMENFVTFVQEDTVEQKAAYDLSGINMNFDLEVTPDAQVRIIFDEEIGDVMRGSGSGNINMSINTAGSFEMYGQYEIREGSYLFTMQNVINKRFTIREGGTINWYGDPYNAELDLEAAYSLRTSLYDLMYGNVEDPENYKKRVPVDLIMHLSNNLMNPDIRFDIRMPTVNEEVRSIASSQMATEEQLNKQAFSLLVLRKFLPNPGERSGADRVGVSSATSSELLSNQLSNWLSSISNDFDIGLNYRPGDEITDEELAVALSTQLFNERLSVSGNLGVSSENTSVKEEQNTLVGDFQIEYDITADGKFKLKAFNESNDRNLSGIEQADYTQGAGVFYQEEFDTARELLSGLADLVRRKNKKEKQKQEEKKQEQEPVPPGSPE